MKHTHKRSTTKLCSYFMRCTVLNLLPIIRLNQLIQYVKGELVNDVDEHYNPTNRLAQPTEPVCERWIDWCYKWALQHNQWFAQSTMQFVKGELINDICEQHYNATSRLAQTTDPMCEGWIDQWYKWTLQCHQSFGSAHWSNMWKVNWLII